MVAVLALSLLATALAAEAQPALEQFRFEPPRLCLRDTFRRGFSYRGFPGGLAAVKDFVMEGLCEGPASNPSAPWEPVLTYVSPSPSLPALALAGRARR